jgi:hypothetical protein
LHCPPICSEHLLNPHSFQIPITNDQNTLPLSGGGSGGFNLGSTIEAQSLGLKL